MILLALANIFMLSQFVVALSSCPYPATCKNVSTIPPDYVSGTYYEHLLYSNNFTLTIDNICSTYFQVAKNKFLAIRTVVFKNGDIRIEKYLQATESESSNVVRSEGLKPGKCGTQTCIYNTYPLGVVCPNTRLFYRCYFYGACTDILEGDSLVGASTSRDLPDCCKEQLEKLANSPELGFGPQTFVQLPGALPRRCVTRVNGLTCTNANAVDPRDAVDINDL